MEATVEGHHLPPLCLNEGPPEWCLYRPTLIQRNPVNKTRRASPDPIPSPTSASTFSVSKDVIEKVSRRNYEVHGPTRGESFSSYSSVPPMVEDQYGTSDSDVSIEEDEAMHQLWGAYENPAQCYYKAPKQHLEPIFPNNIPPRFSYASTALRSVTPTAPQLHRPNVNRSTPTQCSPEGLNSLSPAQFRIHFPPPPPPPPQRKVRPAANVQTTSPQTRPTSQSISSSHSHRRRPTQLSLFPSNYAGMPSDIHRRPSTAPSSRVNQPFPGTSTPPLPHNSLPAPTPSSERSVFEYDSDDERRPPQPLTNLPSSLAARFHIRSLSGGDKRLSDKEKVKRKEGTKRHGNWYDTIGQRKEMEGDEKNKRSFRRSAEGFMRGVLGLGRRSAQL
jgi:hypothetical protein